MSGNHVSKKAVVLVSGGLDSATVLAIAIEQGYQCYALSVDYGQRQQAELECAKKVALAAHQHKIVHIGLGDFGGSSLTDSTIDVPTEQTEDIPSTYVPARNTVFLSVALGWAEVLEAQAIFIGANAVDYSGYPDCRLEYLNAFQTMANLATKVGVEGSGDSIKIEAPLLNLTKAEIIATGIKLGVDYGQTLSCYNPDESGNICGQCDSCRIRQSGFAKAGLTDPAS